MWKVGSWKVGKAALAWKVGKLEGGRRKVEGGRSERQKGGKAERRKAERRKAERSERQAHPGRPAKIGGRKPEFGKVESQKRKFG